MAGLIGRRPIVGLAAGLLFGGLGSLLLGIEGARGLARYLFLVSGWSFLFVAVVSLLSAAYALLSARRR